MVFFLTIRNLQMEDVLIHSEYGPSASWILRLDPLRELFVDDASASSSSVSLSGLDSRHSCYLSSSV